MADRPQNHVSVATPPMWKVRQVTYSVEVRRRAFDLLGQGWSAAGVGQEIGVSRIGDLGVAGPGWWGDT